MEISQDQKPSASLKRVKIPEGLFLSCEGCKEILLAKDLEKNLGVCPKCGAHHRVSARDRIAFLIDPGTYSEFASNLAPADPLEFKDTQGYKDRLAGARRKTGLADAVCVGEGLLEGVPVVIGALEFGFMGGSMGSVVGEKIARAAERAASRRAPLIVCSASGGARMQEGIFSLMQMAKTAAAVARLHEAGVPYFSVLTDPTFGGVTASFAMLGDVILAEPRALIGFAGPRVIEQTIKKQLPEGFQRAEFLQEHGLVDIVVDRRRLKETLRVLIDHLTPRAVDR
jgi:acetyl-CoA carboxylase carboxyl transferase subunit beta